ncbi:hypothetical protein [Acinetobacter sp. ANC 3813]|uniref:hypothetical protein n=1 Tax=Acinetobacter sp. ANC 3813 TaxID=1977873 RepID=UPI000A342F64|nr:hypothetical protein [Acinetobacter sp. ANC 3813]OTG87884.1 hypothetical protein B9T34_16240 [Acinetobacter sp. ANC 3813]
MFKKLENLVLDIPLGAYAQTAANCVTAVLNKPIGVDMLNIVTTGPQRDAQIYGWKSPINEHTDETGYFFFMPIQMEKPDAICIGGQRTELQLNQLYLLDDRLPHSTDGEGNTIALFSGSYSEEELNDDLYQCIFAQFKEMAERE